MSVEEVSALFVYLFITLILLHIESVLFRSHVSGTYSANDKQFTLIFKSLYDTNAHRLSVLST